MHALVLNDVPDVTLPPLHQRLPDVTFHHCETHAQLDEVIAKFEPVASFGIGNSSELKKMLRRAYEIPSMKLVHVGGSGYEQLLPLDRDDVVVTNCVGVLARYLAETTIGAMLALNGHFFTYRRQQQAGQWLLHPFRPIEEQTLLVVGLGAIGGWVARFARGFGMRVIGIRRTQAPHPDVDEIFPPEALLEQLARADVVSVHLRESPQTHHLFDSRAFAALPEGALFLNTARGPIVDTDALMDALRRGHVRGAYLDVFEEEPLPADHPLWSMDQVFMTPHTADNIHGYPGRFAEIFADNVERLRDGRTDWINPVKG